MAKQGYTLIEVLLVVSISAIVVAIGFAGFRSFSRRQVVISQTQRLKDDLKLAKEYALSGFKPDAPACGSSSLLISYDLVFSNDGYNLSAVCSGGSVEVKDLSLETDLVLSPPTPNPIKFYVLGRGTNADEATQITISDETTTYEQVVGVSSTGEIK